jgi:hypothetical protein
MPLRYSSARSADWSVMLLNPSVPLDPLFHDFHEKRPALTEKGQGVTEELRLRPDRSGTRDTVVRGTRR